MINLLARRVGAWTALTAAVTVAPCLPPLEGSARHDQRTPLEAARNAIGGDARVKAIRSLLMKGEYWSSQAVVWSSQSGPRVVEEVSPLEVRLQLPDRFLTIKTSERFERRAGFNRDVLLNGVTALRGGQGEASFPANQITIERRNALQLVLGALARTDVVPGAAVDGGGPNAIRLEEPDGSRMTLELEPGTHVPVRVTYRTKLKIRPLGPIASADPGARGAMAMAGQSDAPDVDVTITFSDRRVLSGVSIPFRITWHANAVKLYEMRFDQIVVDPALSDADFALRH